MTGICEGRVAIVTGAGRGIGREHALELARQGAKVVVNDLGVSNSGEGGGTEPADEVVQAIRDSGGEAIANGADVADWNQTEALVRQTIEKFGRLDVVVNNAGLWKQAPIEEMSDGEWSEMLDTNLTGTFRVTREAVAAMKGKGGGCIVNISSTAGQRGEPLHSHYAATKGASSRSPSPWPWSSPRRASG